MPTPTPSLPSPRTWAADDLITTPRLRADVANAVAFLAQRPYLVGQNNSGGPIATNTNTPVGLNLELTDAWNTHITSGSQNSQVFAPVPGWYLARNALAFTGGGQIAAGFNWTTGGAATSGVRGAVVANTSTQSLTAQCCDLIEQTASGPQGGSGDWIQPFCYQNTGSAANLANGTGLSAPLPTVSVRWVCAVSGAQPLPVPPLTAVPSPITHAWMNASIRDTINFLAYPPIMKAVYTPGSLTLANSSIASPATVPNGTVAVDNYGGYSTSTYTYTAPVAGRYYLYGQANLAAAGSATYLAAGLSVNGGTAQWGDIAGYPASLAGGASVTRRLRLNAGDTVKLVAAQASGSAIAYNAGNQSRFIAVWDGI